MQKINRVQVHYGLRDPSIRQVPDSTYLKVKCECILKALVSRLEVTVVDGDLGHKNVRIDKVSIVRKTAIN